LKETVIAVDDRSRLAYSELLPDERTASAIAFLARASAWFGRQLVNLERIITDNRDAYRSHAFREACAAAGLRRLRANGKAERFIQTVLRECA
jgi:transposase InsO family protein